MMAQSAERPGSFRADHVTPFQPCCGLRPWCGRKLAPTRAAWSRTPDRLAKAVGWGVATINHGTEQRSTSTGHEADARNRTSDAQRDWLVNRLFAASLDLHAAVALVDNRNAADTIWGSIEGLDRIITQVRRAAFRARLAGRPPAHAAGSRSVARGVGTPNGRRTTTRWRRAAQRDFRPYRSGPIDSDGQPGGRRF